MRRRLSRRTERLMRVILESSPIATTFNDFRSGQAVHGKTFFRAVIYENGEQVPEGTHVPTLAQLRQRAIDGNLRVAPSAHFIGAEIAVIPADVVAALPDSTRLAVTWTFSATGKFVG